MLTRPAIAVPRSSARSVRARPRHAALSPADAARLHMSSPQNPMVIGSVLCFDGSIQHDSLLSLLRTRLEHYPHFRQKVVPAPFGLGPPRWQDMDDFDVSAQVVRAQWSRIDEARALEELVGNLMSTPLRKDRPLWQLHHLEAEGASVLVLRIHHCMGDGGELISVLRAVSDGGQAAGTSVRAPSAKAAHHGIWGRIGGVFGAARLALSGPDPASALQGRIGARKRAAFSEAVPLEPLLLAARAEQTTLTALLLAAVAAALERWRPSAAGPAPPRLRALLPVNLRTEGESRASNEFASVFVSLPIADVDGRLRLHEIRAELARTAEHDRAAIWAHLIRTAGHAIPALTERAVKLLSSKASLVISNVPGPREVLHLGGARLRDLLVCAPAPGGIALSVTLSSYAGRVRLSLLADARVIPDPNSLLQLIEGELQGFAPPPRW